MLGEVIKTEITILMTCTGGDLAPEYLKAFRNSARYDVKIIAIDSNPKAIGQHFSDHFEVVPMGVAVGYVERMLKLVKQYSVELIFVGSDPEALILSSNRHKFHEIGCEIASPSIDILENLNDKSKTYSKLKEAGVSQALCFTATNLQHLAEAYENIFDQFGECVVKPALSTGGRDVFVVRSDINEVQEYFGGRELHVPHENFLNDYQQYISVLFPVIVMQRLFEPTYDIDVLSWNGEAKQVIPRLRHNPTGIPFIGNTIKPDNELITIGKEVAKAFNLSWLLDIDVMSTKEGKPVVLEVNPRMSGSCPASIYAGFPLFDDIIALSRGEKIKPVKLEEDSVVLGYKSIVRVKP